MYLYIFGYVKYIILFKIRILYFEKGEGDFLFEMRGGTLLMEKVLYVSWRRGPSQGEGSTSFKKKKKGVRHLEKNFLYRETGYILPEVKMEYIIIISTVR